jgi:hypothetical protein
MTRASDKLMKPSPYSFEELLNSAHKEGVTLFDYNDMKIPCIFLANERFDEIVKACYGRPLTVDANLNILHDDMKHVFVEIVLKFSTVGLEEKVLLYANDNLQFFEHLAKSGIIAIAPQQIGQTSANIFMVQLPRREIVEDALETIGSYLK